MAIAKIILNGVVQMDLTQDTIVANKAVYPETAHAKDGLQIVGTLIDGNQLEYGRTASARIGVGKIGLAIISDETMPTAGIGTAGLAELISDGSATADTAIVGDAVLGA